VRAKYAAQYHFARYLPHSGQPVQPALLRSAGIDPRAGMMRRPISFLTIFNPFGSAEVWANVNYGMVMLWAKLTLWRM